MTPGPGQVNVEEGGEDEGEGPGGRPGSGLHHHGDYRLVEEVRQEDLLHAVVGDEELGGEAAENQFAAGHSAVDLLVEPVTPAQLTHVHPAGHLAELVPASSLSLSSSSSYTSSTST